jgi:putative membrane protein insertion efficiency factor
MVVVSRLVKSFVLFLIRLYQTAVSPLLPMACRHIPTCSQYTKQAVDRFGVRRGGWMGIKRICRCHPWGSFGYDPIEAQD